MLLVVFSLAGCLPIKQQDEVVQDQNQNETEEKAVVPKYQISESYYRTLTPFKPSGARGTVVSNLNTRYDIDEFEEGLLRLSQRMFSTDKYIFQEGQYLDKDTVRSWLSRKENDNDINGLNPVLTEETKEGFEQNPIILAHILEHNFLVKSNDNKVSLGGISIGLALNSVYYFRIDGVQYEYQIPDNKIETEGKKMAQEIVQRLRQIEGLQDVPITIGLFKAEKRTSVIPGHYFAYATVKSGGSNLQWSEVNEKYVLFPSTTATNDHRDDYSKFQLFQEKVAEYFPNYNGIVGTAFYTNDELSKLSIDIDMQFFGKAEVIGFSQYVAGLINQYFEEYWTVEVKVKSVNGQEALILMEPDMKEPFVHIY